MLNKKLIFCCGFAISSLFCARAFAAPVVTTTKDCIVVTVKGDAGVPVTVTMSDDKSQIIGLSQGIFSGDGKYAFSFDYPKNSGEYTFCVNSHRYSAMQTALYYQTDEDEREALYREFTETADIQAFYIKNEIKLSVNMREESDYYALSDKAAVYAYISANKSRVGDFYGIAGIFNEAVEVQSEKEHRQSLEKEVIDELNNAKTADEKKSIITKRNDVLEFDIAYELGYKKLSGSKYIKEFKAVMDSLSDLPYDMEKVRGIFDENVLVQSFNISSAREAQQLISHYSDIFSSLNTSNYAKLHDVDRAKVLNNVLEKCPYKRAYEISDAVMSETEKIKTNDKGGKNTGGGGGGGGGSNGAGVITGAAPQNPQKPIISEKPFDDIDSVSWAKQAIEKLYELKIVNGTGERKFGPHENVTREQFVKMLMGVIGEEAISGVSSFGDVSDNQWYTGYIEKAKMLGIATGNSDNNFGVGESITREDMAVLIYRAVKVKNINLPGGNSAVFTDGEQISDYAKEAVLKLSGAEIINGFDDNTFKPRNTATRAQAAKLLCHIYELSGGAV